MDVSSDISCADNKKLRRKQSMARDGRIQNEATAIVEEDTIMHQKSEVLEECIRRLTTCEKIIFYIKFWSGCCGILYINPPKSKRKCGILSKPAYVCFKCLGKNKYLRHGWNFLEVMIVGTMVLFLSRYLPKILMKIDLQQSLENYFDDESKYSNQYFNLAQYSYLEGSCQDMISFIFIITGFHSLSLFQNFPLFGPRVMAITSTFINMEVVPFYCFLLLMLYILAVGLRFAFGNEIENYRYDHSGLENSWYLLFGDFGIGFEQMQESSLVGAYLVLFIASILLTLVMMNIFIAVVSNAYESALQSANVEFEANVVDKVFYKHRGLKERELIIDQYLKPVIFKSKFTLKKLAKEINKAEKETQSETLRRLLNQNSRQMSEQIRKMDEKLEYAVTQNDNNKGESDVTV